MNHDSQNQHGLPVKWDVRLESQPPSSGEPHAGPEP